MSLLIPVIIGLISIILPGTFLSLALLKKTSLHMFEIVVIGFIFGLMFPPTLTWAEAYLIPISPIFSYSQSLYAANVIILTIIGILLCVQQGVFSKKPHANSESNQDLANNASPESSADLEAQKEHHHHADHKNANPDSTQAPAWMWAILLFLMLLTFATRMMSITTAPKFFEFDPYYDMISTEYVLTFGQQILFDHAAWPTLANGTIHRIEPIVPYLEAYWYNIDNGSTSYLNTTTLSNTSSYYPAIAAALLVFVVFMMIFHDYGKIPALMAAALTAGMPTLVSTFIAGEQLLEPWGIFTMFFFVAAYMLAVKNPTQKRYAILAAIAFISTFLGAHYYTVTAGILTIYIGLQGVLQVLKREDMRDFLKMNALLIGIITIFYVIYSPYGGALADRIPTLVGIPVIVAFPMASLLFVFVFYNLPKILEKYKVFKKTETMEYLQTLAVLAIILLLLIIFTPLGKPVQSYIKLSEHFTSASIPLFATVQEYAPTGFNYNFGNAGFGAIGESLFGVSIIVWAVLLLFIILSAIAIYYRGSRSNMLYLATIIPLAVAGMIEVKYLPHFGVGYIIALAIIIGELTILVNNNYDISGKKHHTHSFEHKNAMRVLSGFAIFLVLIELGPTMLSLGSALAASGNCNTIANQGNQLGYNLYCNTIPQYWLTATAWMRTNIGPQAPRVLAWWDYGDWINWFGNTNAVIRGDNSVAQTDYNTAAQFVLDQIDGINTTTLAHFMDISQAKYVLFDNQIQQKWGALDFLACIDTNQTTLAYANQQGAASGQPYVLGTSSCEINHDPVEALIPLQTSNIGNFCQMSGPSNSNATYVKAIFVYGQTLVNQSYCVSTSIYTQTSPVQVYNSNGTKLNALIIPNSQFYYGNVNIGGNPYADFVVTYLPNGPNNTITDAPTQFYNSNYYQGFMFGKLKGFTRVYPSNFTGINYINSTNQIMIFSLNNYTGGNAPNTPKMSYIHNNYTMPG